VGLTDKDLKDMLKSFNGPVPEVSVNQENRQQNFDNLTTTDDHLMHLTGIATDQNGTTYFKTKNSWGADGVYNGYLYMSESYVRMKTIAIMVHRDAIPKNIAKKLGI
jgi:bleomycin hydrolase